MVKRFTAVKKRTDEFKKTKFVNLWGKLTYPESQDVKCLLGKNEPVSANWWRDRPGHVIILLIFGFLLFFS